MSKNNMIAKRKRIFLAVEGEGEQSFIKWLQLCADKSKKLYVSLDTEVLNGGGYKSMLKNAVDARKKKERIKGKAKANILLVDADRATHDDGWSLSHLQAEAKKANFIVCVQQPNQEGWLLKLFPSKEKLNPDASNVRKQLKKLWPDYTKPVDAQILAKKFTLQDLLRVASGNNELKKLLTTIGFC